MMIVKTKRILVFHGLIKALAGLFEEGKIVFSNTIFSCGISKDRTSLFIVSFGEEFFEVENAKESTLGINFNDVHKSLARFKECDEILVDSTDVRKFIVSGSVNGMKKRISLNGYMSDTIKGVDLKYVNDVIQSILKKSVLQVVIEGDDFKEMIGDTSELNEDLRLQGNLDKRSISFKASADSGSIEYEKKLLIKKGDFIVGNFIKTYKIEVLKEFERAGWIHDFKINVGDTCMLISADVHDKKGKKLEEDVIGRVMLVMSSKHDRHI